MGGKISDRPSADEASSWGRMPDAAVESVAQPSAQGRSEVLPALNRFLTPARNVRSDGGPPHEGTAPSRVAPEPPPFFSVSSTAACSCPPELPRCRNAVDDVRKNRMSPRLPLAKHAKKIELDACLSLGGLCVFARDIILVVIETYIVRSGLSGNVLQLLRVSNTDSKRSNLRKSAKSAD